jgi:hypothetical protein
LFWLNAEPEVPAVLLKPKTAVRTSGVPSA